MTTQPANTEDTIRVDRWLWFARFFKSRNLATKLVQSKKVRLNSVILAKPSVSVRAGDILTFPQAKNIRVIKILSIGERRGPAPEAQALYEDLAPPEDAPKKPESSSTTPKREKGAGRPTKADRRALDKFRQDADIQD
ncbi:RNA-binding S4 domain-containing protein [Sneathiella aquimaris]|uniref:RNA-binding S4 domain-containing protein n=1 Tax=Sneathiella aquimaris TaxID=2599305 RepID=UPI001469B5D4|nr:RNA-binding S4 domain-containing protein [Sneathiella aquimaris]